MYLAWNQCFSYAAEVQASADQVCCGEGHSTGRWPLSHSLSEDKDQDICCLFLAEDEQAHPDCPAGLTIGKTVGTALGPTQVIASGPG